MFNSESQQQQSGSQFSVSDAISIVYWCCHIWWLPLEVLLRHRFGSRYLGGQLIIAALWPMFFAAMLMPEYDLGWTIPAFWIVIIVGVVQRQFALRLDRRGIVRHSQSSGVPLLCRWLPMSEEACKNRWEPILLVMLAIFSTAISPSLSMFLVGALFAEVVKRGLTEVYRHNELLDLRDARIEQIALAERLRDDR